jgi:hypothetical protein
MTETFENESPHEPSPHAETPAVQAPSTEAAPAAPEDIAPPIAALLTSIRAAVAKGAAPDARTAGAVACRSILTVLEAKPGEPLAAHPVAAPSPTSPIAGIFSQPGILQKLAAMSREQLLDLVKQVTAALPARPHTPTSAAPRFHLIQLPQTRKPEGGP